MVGRPAVLISTVILIISFACGPGNNPNLIDIEIAEAREMVYSENPPLVIDVRTTQEFEGELSHIEGAILIPHYNIKDSLNFIRGLNSRNILVVCRTGRRSKIAGNELANLGIKKVYNLKGGLREWYSNNGN